GGRGSRRGGRGSRRGGRGSRRGGRGSPLPTRVPAPSGHKCEDHHRQNEPCFHFRLHSPSIQPRGPSVCPIGRE
ncbi:MAG TPA: hypothetical protein EYM59_03830, partial [Acidimicrobiia bacterium]|nr:hypothetical protein [Acidimicrobiia bacterium]